MASQEEDEQDDYEAASCSTADYGDYEPPEKHHSPIWRKAFMALLILIVITGLGVGGYHLLKNHGSSGKKNSSQTDTAASGSIINTSTKHYDSPNFYLGFDYPGDWQVADSGGGQMSVTSPAVTLKEAGGQSVTGQIIMSIRKATDTLTEFDTGNATASRDSLKITYTKPTQNQRAQTYISFLRYASDANGAALDGIYVTGDSGYKSGQAIPKIDISKVDPITAVTFVKCSDKNCSGKNTPLAIAESSWNDQGFSGPLTNLLKSLSIT